MSHDYLIKVTVNTPGEAVTLAGKIDDEAWKLLEDFAQYTIDLLSTKFVQNGMSATLTIHWDRNSGMAISGELPPWDDVIVFLHRFRPIGLESESTYFFKICNILAKELAHPYFRAIIDEQRKIFSGKRMQALTRISVGDTVLNSDKVLYDWLNSFEYHRDKDKREVMESLQSTFPLDATKALLLGLLTQKTIAINNIAGIIQVILGTQKSIGVDETQPNDEGKT